MYFGANLKYPEYIWMKAYGNSSYAYGCVRKSGQGHQLIYFNFLISFYYCPSRKLNH